MRRTRSSLPTLLLTLLLLALLAACTDEAPDDPSPTAESTPTTAPTPTPRATPTTAPTPTPTPIVPAVEAVRQRVDEAGAVTVSMATLPEAGWLVIYNDDAGEPGEVIGQSALPGGRSRDVTVEIDPYMATSTLHVRLHADTGEAELFDFPDADPPLEWEGAPVGVSFPITLDLVVPALVVEDQAVDMDGQVVVTSASVPEAGWVALHADEDGEPGPVLGQTPLQPGDSENVVITFDWRQATPTLHALLYQDLGIAGSFEPETVDEPYLIQGEPVGATFTATLPLDVFVIDQPVTTGEVVVERVSVNQPAWVAVYTDFAGYADRRIGAVLVEPGVTELITIPVETQGINVTPVMHIQLLADEGTPGELEYPGPDEPLATDDRLTLFSFDSSTGNYLITADQPAGDEVVVPLVVTNMPVWVLIHRPEEEAPADNPGPVLGMVSLPPGIHRDVVVPVEDVSVGETLVAALNLNEGEPDEFEFPEGPDVPLRFLRTYIRAEFALTE